MTRADDDITAWMKGDLNLDRESDLADWGLLRDAILFGDPGAGPRSAALPEPSALALPAGLLAAPATRRPTRVAG